MNCEKILSEFLLFSKHERLPSKKRFLAAAKKALFILETEPSSYRKKIPGTDISGGLLDFRSQEETPIVVVPDIHARPDFVYNILNFVLPKKLSGLKEDIRIVQALEEKKIRLVFLGDILHAEGREKERWLKAFAAFESGVFDSSFMRQEMREGLAALSAVMKCKELWPENFHCLKGNHENIMNARGGGNFPFRKFAAEGRMVYKFMELVYGEEVLEAVDDFEKALPLASCSKNIFLSHAEPLEFFSQDELISSPGDERLVYGLTWTANDEASEGSVSKILSELCQPPAKVQARCIGGHRPVSENYLLRQGGLFVQIHNPQRQNVAVVRPDKTFNPDKDIISVDKGE